MRRTLTITAAAVTLCLTLTACKLAPPTKDDFPGVVPSASAGCPVPGTVPNGQLPAATPPIKAAPNPADPGGPLYYYEVLTVRVYDLMAGCFVESINETAVDVTIDAATASGELAKVWDKTHQKVAVVPLTYHTAAPVTDEQHLEKDGILSAVWRAQAKLMPGSWMTCDLHDVGSNLPVSEDTIVNEGRSPLISSVYCQWPIDLKPHVLDPFGI